jgi:hypothetical protein
MEPFLRMPLFREKTAVIMEAGSKTCFHLILYFQAISP